MGCGRHSGLQPGPSERGQGLRPASDSVRRGPRGRGQACVKSLHKAVPASRAVSLCFG